MIKDRLQIARGSAARITSFLNSFRDYEIIFNTDTNRLGIVLPDKTIVYIGALGINDAFEEGTYIESIEVDSESPNVLNIIRKPIPNPDLELNDNTETSGKYISKIEVDGTNKHKLNITKKDLPQGFSGSYEDLTNKPSTFPPSTHNHDSDYYQKSETYSKAQTDALVGNLQGETRELKSITTQPTGTFTYGDQYYNSTTKGLYYWNGSAWELTGLGEPIAGVIYSFNGVLYFWDETLTDLIQIGGGVDLSNYYTKTEVDNAINSAILGLLGGES